MTKKELIDILNSVIKDDDVISDFDIMAYFGKKIITIDIEQREES